ncbi:DUF2000 domain-containing protein [Microbacterium sp.]|uniref:DUF2000 domain-containing protein n=1 Tax=Microbacterium sp. TaxID=51671 RepID=UPI00281211B7|nr:DUF2000 domain-containing protein [Microbacterium sp.]
MDIGFAPDEIDTAAPTRAARLKWVVVVDGSLPAGRIANATACVGAATGDAVAGLLGPDAVDAHGSAHAGLPWIGCTVLTADAAQLATIREKAAASDEVFVADMPAHAQLTRVYDECLAEVSGRPSEDLGYLAVGLVGPRNRVDRIVGRLPLLA